MSRPETELQLSANPFSTNTPCGGATPQPLSDRLLTAGEVAEMLAVPERWVREHTRGGLLPRVQLGRYVRYRRDVLVAWIEEQEQGGAAWRTHRPRRVGTKRRYQIEA
jgi:excisionase family DNA binding protein